MAGLDAPLELLNEHEPCGVLVHAEYLLEYLVRLRVVGDVLEDVTVDVILDGCSQRRRLAESNSLQPVARFLRRPLRHHWIERFQQRLGLLIPR